MLGVLQQLLHGQESLIKQLKDTGGEYVTLPYDQIMSYVFLLI
jgi:hypothetical protein